MGKAKKKISKKKQVTKRKIIVKQAGAMAIIPYSEILTPEIHKGKFTLVPTPFKELQIASITAKTPPQIVMKRPGKGGGEWEYVPGWWVKKKLNFVFGFLWDFEILGERVDGDFVTVKGMLTINDSKTMKPLVRKSDYGGAEIKYRRDTKQFLDISNDFKAAATDCLKRCAVQLGIAMDVYGKHESKEAGATVVENGNNHVQKIATPINVAGSAKGYLCQGWKRKEGCPGGVQLPPSEYEYSMKIYKIPLCRTCQAEMRVK